MSWPQVSPYGSYSPVVYTAYRRPVLAAPSPEPSDTMSIRQAIAPLPEPATDSIQYAGATTLAQQAQDLTAEAKPKTLFQRVSGLFKINYDNPLIDAWKPGDEQRPFLDQLALKAIAYYQDKTRIQKGEPNKLGCTCPYSPSCSTYGAESVRKNGAIIGSIKAAWRVARCNPITVGSIVGWNTKQENGMIPDPA